MIRLALIMAAANHCLFNILRMTDYTKEKEEAVRHSMNSSPFTFSELP
jgi:hypothetical protein